MIKKLILKDAIGVWILIAISLCGGVIMNQIRPNPSPLVDSYPDALVHEQVGKSGHVSNPSISLQGDVSLDEMREISFSRAALILDARPEIFYRLGHIPGALSLPRDDFQNQYHTIQSVLEANREKVIVVYCADTDCHDSQMVGDALERLGYTHVRIFRGGWAAWEASHLPEEHD